MTSTSTVYGQGPDASAALTPEAELAAAREAAAAREKAALEIGRAARALRSAGWTWEFIAESIGWNSSAGWVYDVAADEEFEVKWSCGSCGEQVLDADPADVLDVEEGHAAACDRAPATPPSTAG